MQRVALLGQCAALSVVMACAGSPGRTRPTSEVQLACAEPGAGKQYDARFVPGSPRNSVELLMVRFSSEKPTSTEAERAISRCIEQATASFRIDYEILATAWFNKEGPLSLNDGSTSIVHDAKTQVTRTWHEREGITPTLTQRDGYTVEYYEDKVAVRPSDKFAMMTILFETPPAHDKIVEILAAEVEEWVGKQPTKWPTTAFAKTGPATDRVAQQEIRGASGRFLSVRFEPASPGLRDQDNRPAGRAAKAR